MGGGRDVLVDCTVLVSWGVRSTADGWSTVAKALDIYVGHVVLTGALYYRLDTCFCPLDGRRATECLRRSRRPPCTASWTFQSRSGRGQPTGTSP